MSNASDFIIENGVLTKYVGPGGDVVIPEEVKAIGYCAFAGAEELKSVTICDGVVEILGRAFFGCKELKQVYISGSVKHIGGESFRFCENLEELTLSEGLESIGACAFYGCKKLKVVTIPRSVVRFAGTGKNPIYSQFCSSGLEEVIIPIGIEANGGEKLKEAFANCPSLRKVTINAGSAVNIAEQKDLRLTLKDSFAWCPVDIVYAPECPITKLGDMKPLAVLGYVDMLELGTFIDLEIAATYEKYIKSQKKKLYPLAVRNEKLLRHMIYKKVIAAADMEQLLEIAGEQGNTEQKALLLDYQSRSFSGNDIEQAKEKEVKKALRVPTDTETLKKLWTTKKQEDGTLMITRYKGHEESVEIPEQIGKGTVTAIGTEAFKKNDTMVSIMIPSSVVRIDRAAFTDCRKLEKVTMANGVTEIGYFAFSKCKSLKEMILPDSVTSIGHGAFSECAVLEKLVLSQGLQTIPGDMVLKCTKLKKLEIPDSVASIDGNPFHGCKGLVDKKGFVVIRNTLYSYHGKDSVISIPENVVKIAAQTFFSMKKVEKIIIPDGVECIGQQAFGLCENLREIEIPNSVTEIEQFAFSGCGNLAKVVLPESITAIGTWTFKRCGSLTSVAIPNSVTEIGDGAFEWCSNLTDITIPNGVTRISKDAFSNCEKMTIHAPAGSYAETYAKENNIPFVAE